MLWTSFLQSLIRYLLIQVPIFIISSVAEELFAFLSVIPEWLCKERQDKVFLLNICCADSSVF